MAVPSLSLYASSSHGIARFHPGSSFCFCTYCMFMWKEYIRPQVSENWASRPEITKFQRLYIVIHRFRSLEVVIPGNARDIAYVTE
jgi:hypothetical protein